MAGATKRDFLKKTGQTAIALATGLSLEEVLNGCANTESMLKGDASVNYPPLKGQKVQPPNDGCLIGLHRHYATIRPDGELSKDTGRIIDYYQQKLDNKPAFFNLCCTIGLTYFPQEEMEGLATKGVIPNILPDYRVALNDISKGSYDIAITEVAKQAAKYGSQHGGFFYLPMRETNLAFWPWGQQPQKAKKAWQHVWRIFEDNGANEYTTWVWGIKCSIDRSADNPEPYYPGDKYVDWIGLSGYSRRFKLEYTFREVASQTYHSIHNSHKDKPIMMAEFGRTQGSDQPNFLRSAYKTIRSWPGMKAALYWDWPDIYLGDDPSLSEASYGVLKEIFKDPYFIGAK